MSGSVEKHPWRELRDEYLNQNLVPREKPFTLKMLAAAYGMSAGVVRAKAADEKWNKILARRRDELDSNVRDKLADSAVFNEVEVRIRQATYARLAQSKAITKLQMVEPKDLSVNQALLLLKLGLEEERKALGFADKFLFAQAGEDEVQPFNPTMARGVIAKLIDMYKNEESGEFEEASPAAEG